MKPKIEVYDTTLRDGTQGEGIDFSVKDKLRIAERLGAFGVHCIEGGYPGSNPRDMTFFREAQGKRFGTAALAAFGSTCKKDTLASNDPQVRSLLEAETPVVTVFGKSWLLHVREVLGTTPEENLRMIRDTVGYLRDQGRRVVYDSEHAFDGYKDDPEYAMDTWCAARDAGAEMIVLCDTNGGMLFSDVGATVQAAVKRLGLHVGIHTHNDTGLAVANTIAAIQAGAVHVQGTVNGYGERTGNCDLVSVIAHLAHKLGRVSVPEESVVRLRELSLFVAETANMTHDHCQPWVGSRAFKHKGGGHVDAVRKNPKTYEHMEPEAVGNERDVLVSDLSGRSNIVLKAQALGLKVTRDTPELPAILARVKELEQEGYAFEAAGASFALLLRSLLNHRGDPPFEVVDYHVSIRSGIVPEATMKVKVGRNIHHTVASGDGPVNALDGALRSALIKSFPAIERVRLTDYKVRILGGVGGSAAKTRVLITSTDGEREWGTVGVHENIVDASLKALVESMEFALLG